MPEWQRIDLPESKAVDLAEREGTRLEFLWAEFDTNDEEDREALFSFVRWPLDSLLGEGEYAVPGMSIDGIDGSWRIVTTLHNHHLGLNPRVTIMMATVSGDDETVYIDSHKQSERGKSG